MAVLSALFSRVWLYLVGAAAALAVLVTVYAKIRQGGRDAQRLDQADAVAKRTRLATQARIEASKPITPEQEKADEAQDPLNRDRR